MSREKGTCSVCRRVRKLVGPHDPRPAWLVELDALPKTAYAERRKLDDKIRHHFHYHYLCADCTRMTPEEREAEKEHGKKRVKERNLKARKAYPVIGGPLDGERALTVDFYSGWRDDSPGMYAHLASEYFEYNSAGRSNPSMVFVHVSCLQPTTSGRNR